MSKSVGGCAIAAANLVQAVIAGMPPKVVAGNATVDRWRRPRGFTAASLRW